MLPAILILLALLSFALLLAAVGLDRRLSAMSKRLDNIAYYIAALNGNQAAMRSDLIDLAAKHGAPAYLRPGALTPKPGEGGRLRPTILRATLEPTKPEAKRHRARPAANAKKA